MLRLFWLLLVLFRHCFRCCRFCPDWCSSVGSWFRYSVFVPSWASPSIISVPGRSTAPHVMGARSRMEKICRNDDEWRCVHCNAHCAHVWTYWIHEGSEVQDDEGIIDCYHPQFDLYWSVAMWASRVHLPNPQETITVWRFADRRYGYPQGRWNRYWEEQTWYVGCINCLATCPYTRGLGGAYTPPDRFVQPFWTGYRWRQWPRMQTSNTWGART